MAAGCFANVALSPTLVRESSNDTLSLSASACNGFCAGTGAQYSSLVQLSDQTSVHCFCVTEAPLGSVAASDQCPYCPTSSLLGLCGTVSADDSGAVPLLALVPVPDPTSTAISFTTNQSSPPTHTSIASPAPAPSQKQEQQQTNDSHWGVLFGVSLASLLVAVALLFLAAYVAFRMRARYIAVKRGEEHGSVSDVDVSGASNTGVGGVMNGGENVYSKALRRLWSGKRSSLNTGSNSALAALAKRRSEEVEAMVQLSRDDFPRVLSKGVAMESPEALSDAMMMVTGSETTLRSKMPLYGVVQEPATQDDAIAAEADISREVPPFVERSSMTRRGVPRRPPSTATPSVFYSAAETESSRYFSPESGSEAGNDGDVEDISSDAPRGEFLDMAGPWIVAEEAVVVDLRTVIMQKGLSDHSEVGKTQSD